VPDGGSIGVEPVENVLRERVGHFAGGGDVGNNPHPARIPQRLPTGKKTTDAGGNIDLESLKADPKLYAKNVDLIRAYPNMPAQLAEHGTHDEVAEHFINHVTDNLLALHDAVPEHTRNRSKLWYDGARNITNKWSKKYNLPDHSIAGALAALSPQKDWYQNVSLANRLMDIHRGYDNNFYNGFTMSPEMEKLFNSKGKDNKNYSLNKPEYMGIYEMLKGKSLGDIHKMNIPNEEKAVAKAMWSRLYDEAHHDRGHRIVTPEGDFGDYVKTQKGEKSGTGWGSLGEISKAIQAIEAANNPSALSRLMGERHKVRNFYNNILNPNSPHGDVTIDTHAVAAGLMRPLSGNSLEVAHNFGNYAGKGLPNAGGSAVTGVQGTYPIYAEAYRRAAAQRGILPREMQSITWEAIRGLFPDVFKNEKNASAIDKIWNGYRNGEYNQSHARSLVNEYAGGIRPPTWELEGSSGANEENGSPPNTGKLPEPTVYGRGAGEPNPGAGGGTSSSIPAQSPSPSGQSKSVIKLPTMASGGFIDKALVAAVRASKGAHKTHSR